MKDLAYHFGNRNDQNVVFGFPNCVHFGDQIAFINVVKNLNLQSYKINPGSQSFYGQECGIEICSQFFDKSIITDEPTTHHFHADSSVLTDAYNCIYHKIPNPNNVIRKYITYSFGSKSGSEEKTPPYLEELSITLKSKYGVDIVVEIGPQIGIKKSIDYLMNSKIFIGLDNGASHLCRCTDTPAIIIEHLRNLERGFPSNCYSYMKATSMNSVLDQVSQII